MALWSRIPEITAAMEPKARAAVRKAAADVEAHAKNTVAVDTGALKNSIQAQAEGSLRSRVNVGMDYAMYVEFGTHKMAAQPYLSPAAENVRPGFEAAMAQIVS